MGEFIALRKIIEEYRLPDILDNYFEPKDKELFLNMMLYSIVTENNAGQYYSNYGCNHPLLSSGMTEERIVKSTQKKRGRKTKNTV